MGGTGEKGSHDIKFHTPAVLRTEVLKSPLTVGPNRRLLPREEKALDKFDHAPDCFVISSRLGWHRTQVVS